MSRRRQSVLVALFILTVLFLSAAAYTFYGNPFERNDPLSIKTLPLDEAPQALRLTIYDTGIAAVTASQLREANLPFQEFNAENLKLSRDDEEIPFYLMGEGNDATLYFYAQAVTDTFDAPAVYWLSPEASTAMREQNGAPSGEGKPVGWQQRRWEENISFVALSSGNDNWLGPRLFAPASHDITLEGINAHSGVGELIIRFWSNNEAPNEPDHHVEILLNGSKMEDFYWDGIKEETITLPLPAGTLQSGENIITINVPGDTGAAGEAIYLDWIELNYESTLDASLGQLHFSSADSELTIATPQEQTLIFDISDPANPIAITNSDYNNDQLNFATSRTANTHYLVTPSNQIIQPRITLVPEWEKSLRDADQGADYIAIIATGHGFEESLQPLLDHRQAQNMRVSAVSLDQIYDEFGFGRQTPYAIRDFLAHATSEWQEPAPRFVLLVGDATYDIYDFTGGKNKNILPTFLVYTEFAGYVASDTWFTLFDDDTLAPSITIGRFPVQSVEQLDVMVRKTIAYETASSPDWVNRALLVADDEPRFDSASDDLNAELEATGYDTQKLYMTENEDIHDAIISALNQGVGILNYVGHGGVDIWGDELVLQSEDADILVNGDRLPIFTTFTCLNGYFNHPDIDALSETLLWASDGGVVAAVAPSGRSFTSQQTPLADVFYSLLLSGEIATVGEALQISKVRASETQNLADVIHTFNLLGDPALQFNLP